MAKKIHFVVVRAEDFSDAEHEAEHEFAERGICCEARGALSLSDGATSGMGEIVSLGGTSFPAIADTSDIEDAIRRYYKNTIIDGLAALKRWSGCKTREEVEAFDGWSEILAFANCRTEGIVNNWGDRVYKFWNDGGGVRQCFSWEQQPGVTLSYDGPTRDDCEGWYVVRIIL